MSTHEDDLSSGSGQKGQQGDGGGQPYPPPPGGGGYGAPAAPPAPPYGQPYSPPPAFGEPPSAPPPGQPFGAPPPGQPFGAPPPGPYGQPGYGQQPSYGAPPQYGQPAYGQPAYGQPAYGQPYGYPPVGGDKPGIVLGASILGFIYGALGVLMTIVLFIAASAVSGASGKDSGPFGDLAGAAAGVLVFMGVLSLALTVVLIWGSVWAVTGRSRVLLLVGSSIISALMGLGFLSNLSSDTRSGGDVIFSLVLLTGGVTMVVLLSLRRAGEYFAARRASRMR